MTAPERRLIWSLKAEADLLDVWNRGAKLFSPTMSDSHLRDIRAASVRLTSFPLSGVARDEFLPGLRSVLIHPTLIFYRVGGDTIEIVRVVDGRRKFGVDIPRGARELMPVAMRRMILPHLRGAFSTARFQLQRGVRSIARPTEPLSARG
jgi:plasmid stabilization system protein ParE